MNDNTPPTDNSSDVSDAMVFILIGEARKKDEAEMQPFNCILAAPDDDTAVRMALESLASQEYVEADLHQIGNLEGRPGEEHDETIRQAYDAAMQGEVAIIAYDGYGMGDDPDAAPSVQ